MVALKSHNSFTSILEHKPHVIPSSAGNEIKRVDKPPGMNVDTKDNCFQCILERKWDES